MPTPDDPMLSTDAADEARRRAGLASLLDQGITAARRGRHERARRLLESALSIDPANEDAWLWLAALTDNPGLARAMYHRVLEDHPESARARDGLRWLDAAGARRLAPDRPAPESPAVEPSAETPVEASGTAGPSRFVPPWECAASIAARHPQATAAEPPSGLEEGATRPAAGEAGQAEKGAQKPEELLPEEPARGRSGGAAEGAHTPVTGAATPDTAAPDVVELGMGPEPHSLRRLAQAWESLRRRLGVLARRERVRRGALVALIGLLVVGSLLLLSLLSNPSRATSVRVALGVITNTPTATPSPTATLTPSVTPTPTHTPTATPSPTPSPTITPIPSPTPTPAWHTAKVLPLPLDEKWIEVDLTNQILYAYEGETRVLTATVSTGKGNTPTVQGKFRIQRKYESQLMTGPGYYLPNVPYIMYFHYNFALHGAYWHDKWGTPTSHGCVNLKREDAKWLYDWTDPPVPEGAKSVMAGPGNQGTWVIVHK